MDNCQSSNSYWYYYTGSMNISWLTGVVQKLVKGQQVIILACNHVDIRPNQTGEIEGIMPGGFAVRVTGIFAKDIQNCQQETRTETVFVEAENLRVVEIEKEAQI